MSVIQIELPAAPAPAPRAWGRWLDTALRLCGLAVLVLAWVSVVPADTAVQRSSAQLLGDLKAGKAHSVQYRNAPREVRWTDGGLRWYRTDISGVGVRGLAPTNGATTNDGSQSDPPDDDYRAWVARSIATSPSHVSYQEIDAAQEMSWTGQVPWRGLSLAAGLTSVAAFCLMLGRTDRRFGNRWAWLWAFLVLGNGAGPFLFLLLEPTLIWQRGPYRLVPGRTAYRGGTGLVVVVGLKIVLAIAVGIALNQLR
jgi:hypothetical protein